MTMNIYKQISKTSKLKFLSMAVFGALTFCTTTQNIYASEEKAPYYGFGTTNGRTDTINLNDYHTNSWERFIFNYLFKSGGNYRYELGKPTTFTGQVPVDVYTANVRRDKNVTFTPPSYGVFSGNVATQPSNYLFEMQLDSEFVNFLYQSFQEDPNLIPKFDTLMAGVNSPMKGNAMNMYDVGQQGVLPNTSVGGKDVKPVGANNATGQSLKKGDDLFYQSSNGSGATVTAPDFGGFLPPTSIGK